MKNCLWPFLPHLLSSFSSSQPRLFEQLIPNDGTREGPALINKLLSNGRIGLKSNRLFSALTV